MISKDKTYCTRGGQEVRIYATDAGGLFPVHGAIFQDGTWHGMKWTTIIIISSWIISLIWIGYQMFKYLNNED